MLRILTIIALLFPISAQAESASGSLNVAVTITRLPQAPIRVSGSRFTQGAASISVSNAGFRDIQPLGQAGANYYFSGVRQGRLYEIAVGVADGRLIRATAI